MTDRLTCCESHQPCVNVAQIRACQCLAKTPAPQDKTRNLPNGAEAAELAAVVLCSLKWAPTYLAVPFAASSAAILFLSLSRLLTLLKGPHPPCFQSPLPLLVFVSFPISPSPPLRVPTANALSSSLLTLPSALGSFAPRSLLRFRVP